MTRFLCADFWEKDVDRPLSQRPIQGLINYQQKRQSHLLIKRHTVWSKNG